MSLPAAMVFWGMRDQHLSIATNVPDSTLCYNVNITAKQISNTLEQTYRTKIVQRKSEYLKLSKPTDVKLAIQERRCYTGIGEMPTNKYTFHL